MSFILIKGKFKPEAGIPDGDSVRFLANDLSLWDKLEGKPVRLGTGATTKNTVQLRFEGIDAIEKGATPPLATEARDSMFDLIDYDEQNNPEPGGYILARMTNQVARSVLRLPARPPRQISPRFSWMARCCVIR